MFYTRKCLLMSIVGPSSMQLVTKNEKKLGALLHITQGTFFESEDVLTRLLMTKIRWSDVG